MPVIVVVIGCQPIDHDRHRTDLGHQTILRPSRVFKTSETSPYKESVQFTTTMFQKVHR